MGKRLWLLVLLALSLSLVFYLGTLYGMREEANSQVQSLEIQGPNLATINSLTKIETRDLSVIVNSQEIRNSGVFFFKITEGRTEVFLRIDNAPLQVTQLNNKVVKDIPKTLDVAIARISDDGLDYTYEIIGNINLSSSDGETLTGIFSDIIDSDLKDIKRFVLLPVTPEDDNIIKSESPDLPALVRQRPAPYFWAII